MDIFSDALFVMCDIVNFVYFFLISMARILTALFSLFLSIFEKSFISHFVFTISLQLLTYVLFAL